ncbi:MAG: DNA polymerase ligase N-terminal domain-containing protein [Fuerstiella sp.]
MPSPSLRFVILEHDHPFLHWDLLLERGEVLAAWRLLRPVVPRTWLPAERLPDHRRMYLDYEGPISRGRGHVTQVASGTYREEPDKGSTSQRAAIPQAVDITAPDLRVFSLYDCELADVAMVRGDSRDHPEWRFQ